MATHPTICSVYQLYTAVILTLFPYSIGLLRTLGTEVPYYWLFLYPNLERDLYFLTGVICYVTVLLCLSVIGIPFAIMIAVWYFKKTKKGKHLTQLQVYHS